MSALIASKKRKVKEETELREKAEFEHIEKLIEREICEIDGKKTIREVETSKTDHQALTRSLILRHKETAKATLEHLKKTDPSELMTHSHNARSRYRDIEIERNSFYNKYPKFSLENVDEVTEALQTYLAAPMVDFTWYDIMESPAKFRLIDFEHILLNKLIWNAVFCKEEHLKPLIDDKTAQLSLTSFDANEGNAVVQLQIKTHDINLLLKLHYADPFLLLLIPDKMSQTRIRTYTSSMATDVLLAES